MIDKNICSNTVLQFKNRLQEIETNSEMLHHDASKRKKRQILIGAALAAGAGYMMHSIMNWESASKYTEDIEKCKQNEKHSQELMKNQTTIIEVTKNVMEENKKKLYKQITTFSEQLINLTIQVNHQRAEESINTFNTMAFNVMMNMMAYQRKQEALIKIMMDGHNGKPNLMMLSPKQLTNQMEIMHKTIATDLKIAGEKNNKSLIQIYKLMQLQAHISRGMIIIEMKVPLIQQDVYNIYKLIPVPTM